LCSWSCMYKLIATLCTRYTVSFDLELLIMNSRILIYWQFHGVGKSQLLEVYATVGLKNNE